MQAAADQHPRGRPPKLPQRRTHIRSAPHPGTSGLHDRLHGQRLVLPRFRHRPHARREWQQPGQKRLGVLGLLHADQQVDRPIRPRRKLLRQDRGGALVMAAVEPQLPSRRHHRSQRPIQPLQPGRPLGSGSPPRDRRRRHPKPRRTQRRDRQSRVIHLVRAGQPQLWQRDRAFSILEPARGHAPIPAPPQQRRPEVGSDALDRRQRVRLLEARHHRHARLDDPRLLRGDRPDRLAQHLLVIQRDRGNRACRRPLDHVGRVSPAAQAYLQHHQVRRHPREQHQRRRRDHLEHGDRGARIDLLHLVEHGRQRGVVHQHPGQPDALVEPHQMRRGVCMHPHPCRLRHRAQEGAGAALPVGAGHMDHRRQREVRITQFSQQHP